ncbi:MAG: IS6 family transposase, partial [Candidatus Caldarchaeales archaeon]|nr:IS6 family transposase [Candidatus Caldarchaeales archaeon]
DTDKFYLSLLGWSLAMMHVIDAVLGSLASLFRFHRYSPVEKLYSVVLFIAGLSLRDLSERLSLTGASRESVRIWVHRFSSIFRPSRRVRRLVAVDETVLKVSGQTCYLWAAIDVDTNEVLAVYASRGRGIPSAIKFLRRVLDSCEGKPVIVVDRGPWYRWALDRLGITYFQETFGKRNRIERWFREIKDRTKMFYNNVNSKTLKSLEELATAIAAMHNIIKTGGGEVIPT